MSFHVPEKYRVSNAGAWSSTKADGNNGAFRIPLTGNLEFLRILASDGLGWEHVSVSLPDRTPTWREMCYVKSLFWDDEDCVVQYHPPRSEYVNLVAHCLHLWRPVGITMPRPPSICVGPREVGA